jgi:hypothetical protein
VGGKIKYLADMRTIMKEYFKFWRWAERKNGANKIVLSAHGNIIRFTNGIDRLTDADVKIELVANLGRLMY